MADGLYLSGKEQAMLGIESAITTITLNTSGAALIATTSVTGTSFAVSAATGQLSNTAPINFTIDSGDIGTTASLVRILGADGELIRIDLETPVAITTAGTATLATGALTADL